jgi:hypothetical protein
MRLLLVFLDILEVIVSLAGYLLFVVRQIVSLQLQQSSLDRQSTTISNKPSVASDYSMARDDYADGVCRVGIAHSSNSLFIAYVSC